MRTYIDFVRISSNYLSRADETGLSITSDLTFGCWVYFDPESDGVPVGIIGKWNFTANKASYLLYKDSDNKIIFIVSDDGTTTYQVNDLGANFSTGQWFYVVGRFTPQEELALFVNGMWYINTTGVPAALYDNDINFEIGRYNENNYLDGRISQAFISAYSIPDRFICSMYSHAKALYMTRNMFQYVCSSSSSSTSSSSSSSSTTSSSSSSSSSSTTSSSSSSVIP